MVDINKGVKGGARIRKYSKKTAVKKAPKKSLRQTIKDRQKRILDI